MTVKNLDLTVAVRVNSKPTNKLAYCGALHSPNGGRKDLLSR